MTEENKNPEAASQEAPTGIQFAVQRIYLKDLSFEAPNGLIAPNKAQPKVNQDLNTQVNRVGEDLYEVVLNVTVSVKVEEDKTAFLVEVHQAGLFVVKGAEGQQLQHMLTTACPTILFPYVREIIDSTAVRGGFPPLALPPINFDALFARAMNEAKQKQEAEATH